MYLYLSRLNIEDSTQDICYVEMSILCTIGSVIQLWDDYSAAKYNISYITN
jgi:hypothetical protein